MIDVLFDLETYDIDISKRDIEFTIENSSSIIQRLNSKFKMFNGEWFLDATSGVKWYDVIFSDGYDSDLVANELKAVLVDDPDVSEILNFSLVFDDSSRSIKVSYSVSTIYGGTVDNTISLGV